MQLQTEEIGGRATGGQAARGTRGTAALVVGHAAFVRDTAKWERNEDSVKTASVILLVFAAFGTLAARAFWVQVVNQDFYVVQGQKRYQRTIELDATRGRIVDRNGSMLAVSLATYEIWSTPKLLDEASKTAAKTSATEPPKPAKPLSSSSITFPESFASATPSDKPAPAARKN